MWITLAVIAAAVCGICIFLSQPRFGSIPKGERLERILNSPHYRDGSFRNLHPTPQLTSDKSFAANLVGFLFRKTERLRPGGAIPSVKTDLRSLDRDRDMLVWFGHSSYLLQLDGKRILVDPVLKGAGSPVSFINRPFRGTEVYRPEDIPEIDYLIISHDHWDHLDYGTVRAIKDRVGKVICGLGVGQHFERWGFGTDRLIELDWNEEAVLADGFRVWCLPARHFSGRGLKPNRSLWASFLLEAPSRKVYIGGDSGYDTHYAEIAEKFDGIDLAILENGQYNADWKYIHTLPDQIAQTFGDLRAKRLFTVHHSKFALAKHPWEEPLKNIAAVAERESIPLIQPMIGEPVDLDGDSYELRKWWEGID